MVKNAEGSAKVKKPKTEAMKKRKKVALKEKKRALKAAQPLQPLQQPSKRKRAEDAQSDAPEDGQAPAEEPATQPDGAPAEGEKRTRRKKRATTTTTTTAEPEDPDALEEDGGPTKAEAPEAPTQSTGQSVGAAKIACTLFVGQLPYGATANDVSRHFKKAAASGSVQVRMLASKEGKSRGMAFVELSSESDVHSALRLHHSQLGGRRINVERTVG